jgi:hypothetical protein
LQFHFSTVSVDNDVGSLPKTPLSRITAIYFGLALKFYATQIYLKIMTLTEGAQYWRAIPAIAPAMRLQLWINTVVQRESQAGSGIPGGTCQRSRVADWLTSFIDDRIDARLAQI